MILNYEPDNYISWHRPLRRTLQQNIIIEVQRSFAQFQKKYLLPYLPSNVIYRQQ